MPDYTSRADEMLKDIEAVQAKLPEEAVKRMRQAVYEYLPNRKKCLDELLEMLGNDKEGENVAEASKNRCQSMRASIPSSFENALKNIVLSAEGATAGFGWQLTVIANEDAFFNTLATVNPAETRDFLIANRKSLREYTEALDQKWKTICNE